MGKLPLVPVQLVARIRAYGKVHDARRAEIAAAGITHAYSTPDKKNIVVVLKDRVTPGSEKRKFYEQVKGAILHVQANECGPFCKGSGSYAQIITNMDGQRLAPVVDFAKIPGGFVAEGGHRAIFDSPTLVVLKGYQDMNKVTISKLTPFAENGEAWIHDEMLCVIEKGDALPEEFAKFGDAYAALLTRMTATATQELHFGL